MTTVLVAGDGLASARTAEPLRSLGFDGRHRPRPPASSSNAGTRRSAPTISSRPACRWVATLLADRPSEVAAARRQLAAA
jgi:hypothetical protein